MITYFKRKSQNLSTAIEVIYGLRVNNEPDKSLQFASETFSGMVDFDLENILGLLPMQCQHRRKLLRYV